MNNSKRLFTAIRFPEKTIEQIKAVQDQVRKIDPLARFVKPVSNFHVTLYFIGMTSEEDSAREGLLSACQRYQELDGTPIDLKFSNLGLFRNRGGHLIWLGIENNEHLNLLAKLIPEELNKNGIEAHYKKYKPHITLARKFKGNTDIDFIVPDPIIATDATLVWSHHNEEDILVYDNLYSYPFIKN